MITFQNGVLTLSNFTVSDAEILTLLMSERGGMALESAVANVIRVRRIDQRELQRAQVKAVLDDPAVSDILLKSLYEAVKTP